MAKIKSIRASEILDSRGNPTIEANVILSDGTVGTGSVPSGSSVGKYEAMELRDHDEKRFNGMGVLKAIQNIEQVIAPELVGKDIDKQRDIDRLLIELDGTQNKGRLGANSTLAVSIACATAASKNSHLPVYLYLREYIRKEGLTLKIPTPIFNIINGGMHAGWNLDFQEFQIIPASSKTYRDSIQMGVSVYKNLAENLKRNNLTTLVGDEGGYAPALGANDDALALITEAISVSNLRLGYDIFCGLDCAASNFYTPKGYKIKDKGTLTAFDLISYYQQIIEQHHLIYLEDPLSEDDWEAWTTLGQTVNKETIITGDDLTTTNPYRLQMALDKKAVGGIIIKPNQIGTVIEALAVVEIARESGIKIIVSHRSGETTDDFIADFAVAVSADYVKFGAPARGERVVKYNRLMHIEEQIKQL